MNEPDIPRIAKRVKNRVARLRALGNCVVPAQAYPIFRAIVETERGNYGDEYDSR
jgi:DNA (cytosine-5)-methyltransferase 1